MRFFTIFIVLFIMFGCNTTYYNYLNGVVVDESGDTPLKDVDISYQLAYGTTKAKTVKTNTKGVFKIEQELKEVSDGIILTIQLDGYQTIVINSEYKDWYEPHSENSMSKSLEHDFGTIRLTKNQ